MYTYNYSSKPQHLLVFFLFYCCLFSTQFQLSNSDKELLEREDRGESQQEILRRIAKDLPIYTRTNSGGTHNSIEVEEHRPTPLQAHFSPSSLVCGQKSGDASADDCLIELTVSSAIRFCERCQLLKPDRCHHCSVCDKYDSSSQNRPQFSQLTDRKSNAISLMSDDAVTDAS